MRDVAGDNSLRRRLGLGAWLAVGALLAFGVVQASLVVAAPATVNAAGGAQTQSANAESQQFVAFTAAQSQTCSYPDVCTTTTTTAATTETTVATSETTEATNLPTSRDDCAAIAVNEFTTAPYVQVDDNCSDDREVLRNANCTVVESIGINDLTIQTDDPAVIAAYANADSGTNIAIFQVWTCADSSTVSFTTHFGRPT